MTDGWISLCCASAVWLSMSRNLSCPGSVINNASSLTLFISPASSLLLLEANYEPRFKENADVSPKSAFLNIHSAVRGMVIYLRRGSAHLMSTLVQFCVTNMSVMIPEGGCLEEKGNAPERCGYKCTNMTFAKNNMICE